MKGQKEKRLPEGGFLHGERRDGEQTAAEEGKPFALFAARGSSAASQLAEAGGGERGEPGALAFLPARPALPFRLLLLKEAGVLSLRA